MENLFATIRSLVSDSRMIAINTGIPQYKVQQVKTKMFYVVESQEKYICDWWLRLYKGEYSEKDFKALMQATEDKYYILESDDFKEENGRNLGCR